MNHISPSQIVRWRDCERRYWFEYGPHATRGPETKAQALGRELHSQLETWIETGVVPPDARAAIALDAIERRPGRQAAELDWAEFLSDSVAFRGTIDVVDLSGAVPIVLDWKTTRDFSHMRTPELLARDVQMTMYGQQVLAHVPEAQAVVLRHVYLRTRGRPKVQPIECTVTRTALAQQRVQHLSNARRMLPLRVLQDGRQAQPTGRDNNACFRFGRCPHKDRCDAMPTLLPPDTARRPEGSPFATIDNVSPALQAKILDTKTKRAEYEAMAESFKQQIAGVKAGTHAPTPKAGKPKPWEAPAAPAAATTVTTAPSGTVITTTAPEGTVLYLGPLPPRGVVTTMVERWAAPLGATASERLGVDWRLAPFGAGPATLATLAETAPVPESLYCDSSHALVPVLKTRFRRTEWVCGHCGESRAVLAAGPATVGVAA